MFSSVLDTVRIVDEKQLSLVEAFLMRSALSGNPAVLSPNQAIDSAVIQAIVAGNEKLGANHFIRAVEKGIVRISLPDGTRTLLEHCLNTIHRSKNNPNNEFIFSSLKFLYAEENGHNVYDYDLRMKILEYISNELSQSRYRGHRRKPIPVRLPPEDEEQIYRYIQVMTELDQAIRYYDQYSNKKEMYPKMVMHALVERLQMLPPKSALAELITLVIQECAAPDCSLYRSYYYRFCDSHLPDFGADAVREVREILDICYNKLIAISMNEHAEINIAPDLHQTAALQASESDVSQTLLVSANRAEAAAGKLDWEMLVEIYDEIDALCREKGLHWQEALKRFYAQQSALPFVLGGKYAVITSLTIAISSIPLVGGLINHAVAEILVNSLFGEMEDVLGKPTVKEIVEQSKKASKRVQMMDFIVCTDPNLSKIGD